MFSVTLSGLRMHGGHPVTELVPCYFILEELKRDALLLLHLITVHAVLLNHMLLGSI